MRNQEKFYRLLDTLRTGAEAAGTLALGALGLACEGAEKAAEAVRLRCQAARVEGEMDGKLVYATHTGNPTESGELLEKLREIDELKARLAQLNEAMGRTEE